MSRCTCVRGADILCRYCESRMEAAEYDDRASGDYADARAAHEWAVRDY